MGTATRYYGSGNTGSGVPTLANNSSDLTNLLAACLYGAGFGSVTLTSVTNSGTTATATVSGGHGFLNKQVVTVTGAAETEYNGTFRITYISSTQFSYVMSGTPSGSGTGTITAKLPAVGGWQALYSGTGKLSLNSTDLTASGRVFRIDDTGTTYARIVGYESMTDVDTGSNAFPTGAQISGGGYLHKSSSATTREWWLVADPKCVWLSVKADGTYWHLYGFGDFQSLYSGDTYNSFVMCANGASMANSAYAAYMNQSTSAVFYAARNGALSAGAVKTPMLGIGLASGYAGAGVSPNFAYPSPTGVNVIMNQGKVILAEYQSEIRGLAHGIRQVLNNFQGSVVPGEVRVGLTGFDDGVIFMKETNPLTACFGFDLGDW